MVRSASAAAERGGSIDDAEVAKFSAMAAEWWDPQGPFRPLHRLNPLRLAFIRDSVCARLGRDPLGEMPLKGVRLLDVGCGGGLLCEPLTRLGAEVTGIDASEENIAVARVHAEESGLAIDYRCAAAETLCAEGVSFDAVISMEVVEHVADVEGFLASCGRLVGPGGASPGPAGPGRAGPDRPPVVVCVCPRPARRSAKARRNSRARGFAARAMPDCTR